MNYQKALELFSSGVMRSHDRRSEAMCQAFINNARQADIEALSAEIQHVIESRHCAITSDLHINHKNIIEYCNRPFKNVEDMNEALYEHLLAAQEKHKCLLIVGDVVMGMKDDGISMLGAIKDLLGIPMYLVTGNHDLNRSGKSIFPEWLFDKEVPFLYFELEGKTVIVSHYPLFVDEQMLKRAGVKAPLINVHGHTHNHVMENTDNVKYINVCWDHLYKLVDLKEHI